MREKRIHERRGLRLGSQACEIVRETVGLKQRERARERKIEREGEMNRESTREEACLI